MKRDHQGNDGGDNDNKRKRQADDVVRLLIPSRIAGAVIGKGGQHIQKLRSQFKATVSVDDCQGPERTILISSDPESVINIVKEMFKYFEEREDEIDVRMLIHQSLAGCVIGKGGSKIKEIRDKIGCRILKVFSNVAPQSTDRIVQVIGKGEQCVEAVEEVLNLTRDTPIKGVIHNYDPVNFDDVYADEYGGFGEGRQNGGGGGGGGGGAGGGGGGGGGAGGNFRGDRLSRPDRRGGDRFNDRGGRREDDRSRSGGRRNDREYINPWASSNLNNGGGSGNFGSGGGGGGGFNNGGGFGSGGGGGFGSGGNFGSGGGGGGNFGSSGSFGSGGNFGSGGGNFGSGGGGGNFGSGSGGSFGPGGGSGGGFGSGGSFGGSGFGGGSGGSSGFGSNMGGGGAGFGGGRGGGGGNMNGGGGNQGGGNGENSTQVSIPKDFAGAIIGKAGNRIRRIRNESGAYITIDEPLPGSNDRIITISGTPKQIQMAQYLLQQSVRENRNKF